MRREESPADSDKKSVCHPMTCRKSIRYREPVPEYQHKCCQVSDQASFWKKRKGKQTTRNGYLHEPGRVDSIDACSRNDSFANTEYGTEYLLWELG